MLQGKKHHSQQSYIIMNAESHLNKVLKGETDLVINQSQLNNTRSIEE